MNSLRQPLTKYSITHLFICFLIVGTAKASDTSELYFQVLERVKYLAGGSAEHANHFVIVSETNNRILWSERSTGKWYLSSLVAGNHQCSIDLIPLNIENQLDQLVAIKNNPVFLESPELTVDSFLKNFIAQSHLYEINEKCKVLLLEQSGESVGVILPELSAASISSVLIYFKGDAHYPVVSSQKWLVDSNNQQLLIDSISSISINKLIGIGSNGITVRGGSGGMYLRSWDGIEIEYLTFSEAISIITKEKHRLFEFIGAKEPVSEFEYEFLLGAASNESGWKTKITQSPYIIFRRWN